VARGDFTRWDLALSEATGEFLAELGRRTADLYLESVRAYGSPWELYGGFNAQQYAERLFKKHAKARKNFVDFAAEVLAAWCDESYSGHTCGRAPIPYDDTPSFDSVSYLKEAGGRVLVSLVQAKATEKYPEHEGNVGVRKLKPLDAGAYQYELVTALAEVAKHFTDEADKRKVLSAAFAPELRRYRVVVVHGCAPPSLTMTKYAKHVSGPHERRNGAFLHLDNWGPAWDVVEEAARAALHSNS
jgi:hypothetical protein